MVSAAHPGEIEQYTDVIEDAFRKGEIAALHDDIRAKVREVNDLYKASGLDDRVMIETDDRGDIVELRTVRLTIV